MLTSQNYTVRKKIFNWLGEEFEVFDPQGQVVLFGKQKAFKLREELKIFTSSKRDEEVMYIKARRIMDFSATYDIFDSKTDHKIGALQRKGLQSLLKDEWRILDVNDNEIGKIEEDDMMIALIRRFLLNLIPQKYSIKLGEKEVAEFTQQFNPFIFKLDVSFKDEGFDKRLGLAGAILLSLIEGRQE